jgi:hypothetical protein
LLLYDDELTWNKKKDIQVSVEYFKRLEYASYPLVLGKKG